MAQPAYPAEPTVFISSSIADLRDLRGALAYVLRERGFSTQLSEANDFAVSGDRTALEECFGLIRASDYYVVLIWDKVGSWFDADHEVSVTNQEYRVALESFFRQESPDTPFRENGSAPCHRRNPLAGRILRR